MLGTRPPLRNLILTFSHFRQKAPVLEAHAPPTEPNSYIFTFSPKSACVGGPRPPTGNPGSAFCNCLKLHKCTNQTLDI